MGEGCFGTQEHVLQRIVTLDAWRFHAGVVRRCLRARFQRPRAQSPRLPAWLLFPWQFCQEAHLRQRLWHIVPRHAKAAARFAFQFVRHAARLPFSAQSALSPFPGLGNQFLAL